jgi:hypothetical protein
MYIRPYPGLCHPFAGPPAGEQQQYVDTMDGWIEIPLAILSRTTRALSCAVDSCVGEHPLPVHRMEHVSVRAVVAVATLRNL